MALPTQSDILTLQYSADGSPWCKVAFPGVDVDTLEYSSDGSPWWGVEAEDVFVPKIIFM